jgi:thiosulfate reductase cytochrome b subunit
MKTVEKHALWLRIVHWLNVPLLSMMIWSGILIYWANDIYPGFFPQWFYEIFNIESRLSFGIGIHFMIGWLFVINGLIYLAALFLSGHWREIFPNRASMKQLVPTILHDMGLSKVAPPREKFNAAQRIAYTQAIAMGIIGVLSGFAIYKPVQLNWLTKLFGGYEGARLVHFIIMLAFCGFVFVHLVQVLRAGWNNFRAMVAGFEVEEQDNVH